MRSEICRSRITWEVLAHTVDVWEPGAAPNISLVDNKVHEPGMKTSRPEIMKHLLSLCKFEPDGLKVPHGPSLSKMIEIFQATVAY